MELEIELVPHVGTEVVDGIESEVDFNQYIIRVTGGESFQKANSGRPFLDIGYVSKSPTFVHEGKVYDSPINWTRAANRWPPAVRDKMAAAVQAKLAEKNAADAALAESGKTRPVNEAPPEELDAIADRLISGESASDGDDVAAL